MIYVERSIDFDTGEGFDNMNYASVGECWTWSPYHSSSYCQNFSLLNNNRISVVLCGYVHPSSIDWVETIYLNTYRCKDEKEIRMNNNAVVEIAYIRIGLEKYRFGGSYLINASANESNKERWWHTHTTKVGGIACFYYRKIYESLTFNYVGIFFVKKG